MAKVNVKFTKKVRAELKKKILLAARSEDIREAVAQRVVNDIRGNYFKAKKSTIRTRGNLEKKNKTHPTYKRPFINFTFTGALLDDLLKNVKVGRVKNGVQYVIKHSNRKHKFYKNSKGKAIRPKGGKPTFNEIYEWLKAKGSKYNYLKFKPDTKKKILGLVRAKIYKKLK